MIYLYLDAHQVKLLSLAKTMLGQFNVSFFHKDHSSVLLEKNLIPSPDITASAIKEAISLASPYPVKEQDVLLILPQDAFSYTRVDLTDSTNIESSLAIAKEKLRTMTPGLSDTDVYITIPKQQGSEKKLAVYALKQESFDAYQRVFDLLGLKLKVVLPDTVSYYTLFEKTLRAEKREIILYTNYDEENTWGYLYDSFGLMESDRVSFAPDPKQALKQTGDTMAADNRKINRLILSGPSASKVRQDLFTKEVGIWTNPLEKIIHTFYDQYLKILLPNEGEPISFMEYDVCLGGFIYEYERRDQSPIMQTSESKNVFAEKKQARFAPTATHSRGKSLLRDGVLFLIALACSFGSIYAASYYGVLKIPTKQPAKMADTPTPTAKTVVATPSAAPTPSLDKETLTIKILNGEGTPGFATKVGSKLKDKGYSDIVSGNADSFDVKTTTVQVKKELLSQVKPIIIKDLSDFVDIKAASISAITDTTENADIILIVGSDFILE